MRRRTILQVAYPLAPVHDGTAGGAEQVLLRLDEAVAASGHRSLVVAAAGSRVHGRLVATPAPVGDLVEARAAAHRAHADAVARVLASTRVDLVHLHGVDFDAYLPPEGVPALVTLHLAPQAYAPGALDVPRRGTYFNCVSFAQLAAGAGRVRAAAVVPNGVPLDELRPSVRKRAFVLSIARICPEKGVHLALDAARRAGRPIVLAGAVFGYPDHRRYFEQEVVPRLGPHARFVGSVAGGRKRRLLSAARCLVVASLAEETSSLVAMEALACGTPVVALRRGALPEIVEHGRTGYVVDRAGDLPAAIEAAGGLDPAACRRAAEQRFSAATMTRGYLELYEQILRGRVEPLAEALLHAPVIHHA
jgi:glycosyltransferase involved in cell wall biosynthesis